MNHSRPSFEVGEVVSPSRFGVGVILNEWRNWTDTDERGVKLPVNGAGV